MMMMMGIEKVSGHMTKAIQSELFVQFKAICPIKHKSLKKKKKAIGQMRLVAILEKVAQCMVNDFIFTKL